MKHPSNRMGKVKRFESTYNAVTLELLQVTPSHGAPQGSLLDLSQLGGVFCHWAFKDLSATTDPPPIWVNLSRSIIIIIHLNNWLH